MPGAVDPVDIAGSHVALEEIQRSSIISPLPGTVVTLDDGEVPAGGVRGFGIERRPCHRACAVAIGVAGTVVLGIVGIIIEQVQGKAGSVTECARVIAGAVNVGDHTAGGKDVAQSAAVKQLHGRRSCCVPDAAYLVAVDVARSRIAGEEVQRFAFECPLATGVVSINNAEVARGGGAVICVQRRPGDRAATVAVGIIGSVIIEHIQRKAIAFDASGGLSAGTVHIGDAGSASKNSAY